MSEVQRYEIGSEYGEHPGDGMHGRMFRHKDGAYVLYSDYADLQAGLEEERAELEEIKRVKLQFALEAQAAFTAKCAELQRLRTENAALKSHLKEAQKGATE